MGTHEDRTHQPEHADAGNGQTPSADVGQRSGHQTSTHPAQGGATDVLSGGSCHGAGSDFLTQIRDGHRREPGHGEPQQTTQSQQRTPCRCCGARDDHHRGPEQRDHHDLGAPDDLTHRADEEQRDSQGEGRHAHRQRS